MKRRLTIVSVLVLALALVFSMTACNKDEGGNVLGGAKFEISATSLVMNAGDTRTLTVTKDGGTYDGIVSWQTSNSNVANVKQGIVTALRAGSAEITAKVEYNGESMTLKCAVTVNDVIDISPESIVAYSGGGDVNVSIPSGVIPAGATIDAYALVDRNGNDIASTNLVSSGLTATIRNDVTTKCPAGKYTVKYRVTSSGGAVSEMTRAVNILKADKYSDLFVLDPVDGTEEITGLAAEQGFLAAAERNDKNIGTYVTYNETGNTGYTADNGLNETAEEFHASLEAAGYNGGVDNNVTFRMQITKTSDADNIIPYTYMTLYDTANPIWTHLDELPDTATLRFWMRGWYRVRGEEEFKPQQVSGAGVYKCMSDGTYSAVSMAGGVSYVNGWSIFSYNLAAAAVALNGTKNIALGNAVSPPDRQRGEAIVELYCVEINTGMSTEIYSWDGKINAEIPGDYTGAFDTVEREVYEIGGKKLEYANDGVLDRGKYDVKYVLKKNGTEFDTVELNAYSGVFSAMEATSELEMTAWGGPKKARLADLAAEEAETGLTPPEEDPFFKDSGKDILAAGFVGNNYVEAYFGVEASKLINSLDEFNDSDYLQFNMWFPEGTITRLRFFLSPGQHGAGGNNPNTGNTAYVLKDNTDSSLIGGQWNKVKVRIRDIKELLAQGAEKYPQAVYTHITCAVLYAESPAKKFVYVWDVEFVRESAVAITIDSAAEQWISAHDDAVPYTQVRVENIGIPTGGGLKVINVYRTDNNSLITSLPSSGGTFEMPLYPVTLKVEDLPAPDAIFDMDGVDADVSLPALYDDYYDGVDIALLNEGGDAVETSKYAVSGTDFTLDITGADELPGKHYKLKYTFRKGGSTVGEVERDFYTGVYKMMETKDDFLASSWGGGPQGEETTLSEAGISAPPTDSPINDLNDKTLIRKKAFVNSNAKCYELYLGFLMADLWDVVDNMRAADSIRIWFYAKDFPASSCTLVRFTLAEQTHGAGKEGSDFYTAGSYDVSVATYGKINEWVGVDITVGKLRELNDAGHVKYPSVTFDQLLLQLAYNNANIQATDEKYVYVWDVEYVRSTATYDIAADASAQGNVTVEAFGLTGSDPSWKTGALETVTVTAGAGVTGLKDLVVKKTNGGEEIARVPRTASLTFTMPAEGVTIYIEDAAPLEDMFVAFGEASLDIDDSYDGYGAYTIKIEDGERELSAGTDYTLEGTSLSGLQIGREYDVTYTFGSTGTLERKLFTGVVNAMNDLDKIGACLWAAAKPELVDASDMGGTLPADNTYLGNYQKKMTKRVKGKGWTWMTADISEVTARFDDLDENDYLLIRFYVTGGTTRGGIELALSTSANCHNGDPNYTAAVYTTSKSLKVGQSKFKQGEWITVKLTMKQLKEMHEGRSNVATTPDRTMSEYHYLAFCPYDFSDGTQYYTHSVEFHRAGLEPMLMVDGMDSVNVAYTSDDENNTYRLNADVRIIDAVTGKELDPSEAKVTADGTFTATAGGGSYLVSYDVVRGGEVVGRTYRNVGKNVIYDGMTRDRTYDAISWGYGTTRKDPQISDVSSLSGDKSALSTSCFSGDKTAVAFTHHDGTNANDATIGIYIAALSRLISEGKVNDNDYISVYAYYDDSASTGFRLQFGIDYMDDSKDYTLSAQDFDKEIAKRKLTDKVVYFGTVNKTAEVNKWHEAKITIAELKAMITESTKGTSETMTFNESEVTETRSLVKYLRIAASGTASNDTHMAYIRSIEFHKASA